MSSNIKIQRICDFCNKEFTARTTVTKYCSHSCASKSYKQRTKATKIDNSNKEVLKIKQQPIEEIKAKDFLTVKEVSKLLGISIRTIYHLLNKNVIEYSNLNQRLIRIKRTDIDKLFNTEFKPMQEPQPIQINYAEVFEIENYYTITEVLNKYKIAEATLRRTIKKNDILKIKKGKFVYVPKKIIDKILM